METKIRKHAFVYGGVGYFRDNAINIQLGSFGEKEDPLGDKARIEVQGTVRPEYLEGANVVKGPTVVDIDWSRIDKADLEGAGSIRVFGQDGKASVGLNYEKAKSAKLKLAHFSIAEGQLKRILNGKADTARSFLAREGGDGRVVSEVWVVMDAKLAERFSAAGSVAVAAGSDKKLTLKAAGGSNGSLTISMEEGTTFAYALHKVKDWTEGKKQIQDLEADRKGLS